MSLASDLLSALGSFRSRVASQVNSGLLLTLDDHIAQLAPVVEHDVQVAEEKAHEVLSALYTALHGAPAADAPVPAAAVPVEGTLAAPLQADPAAAAAAPASPSATSAPAAPAPGGKAS